MNIIHLEKESLYMNVQHKMINLLVARMSALVFRTQTPVKPPNSKVDSFYSLLLTSFCSTFIPC